MSKKIYVFDPTRNDTQSKVRGVGRYMQILNESFKDQFIFVASPEEIPYDSVFINPFYNLTGKNNIRKRVSKKQIAVIHDVIPLAYPSHFPLGITGTISFLQNKFALKYYDIFVTDSYRSKTEIVRLLDIPKKKIVVIYPTLPSVFNNSSLHTISSSIQNIQKPYYIYVGDATWNKNLYNLGRAITKGDTPCVFVGNVFRKKPTHNPWERDLVRFFKLSHNDKRFIFTGYVTDNDLIYLYKNAFLNLLVSYDEGFGFSYLEASTYRCPSLLSDTPVSHEIAQKAAYYVSPYNPEEITRKLDHIRKINSKNNNDMGNQAYMQVQAYAKQHFIKRWLHIVR